jgi:tryptophan-rich sensory protein
MNPFLVFIACYTFVFFQIYRSEKFKGNTTSIPDWVFKLVWFVLQSLDTLAIFFYLYHNDGFVMNPAIPALWIVHELLRKEWTRVFVDEKMPKLALLIAALIAATAVALVAVLGVDQHWLSFGLFIPVAIWCGFAVILNGILIN